MNIFDMPKRKVQPGDGDLCKKCENMKGGCKWAFTAELTEQGKKGDVFISLCSKYEPRNT